MTQTVPIFVAFVVALGCAWVIRTFRHLSLPVELLMRRVDSNLAPNLYPFVEPGDSSLDDSHLLAAMGGVAGIHRMHRDAGLFVSLAIRLRKAYPEDAGESAREMLRNALYLRLMTWMALIEVCAGALLPGLPRVQARSCAYLYCEIASSLDVVLSICVNPSTGRIA